MIKVAYSNCKRIFCLTEEQKMQIRKDLTFKNPAYESVLKYSKYAKTKVPPYLHYYKDNKAFIEVPMGYVLKVDDFEVVNDSRVVNTVGFPKFVLELRDIQKQATEAWLNSNYPYGTLVLPTGSGKSLCGIYLAGRMSESTLIVVNKDDLIEGWKKDIELAYNGEADVGLVKGKVFKLGKHFTLTTIQTLSRLGEVKLKQLYEHIGFIICDECLVGDTKVALADGGLANIKDIVNGENVLGGKVSNTFNRKAEIFELRTECGVIKGSFTHPTWCVKIKPNGKHKGYTKEDFIQRPLGLLDSSYYVPVPVKVPHTEKFYVPDIEAKFAALIMCDGHLDKRGDRVKVNVSKDLEFYEDIFKEFSDFYGVVYKKSKDARGNSTLWFQDHSIKELLESKWLIPRGKKSDKIVVPNFMYYAPLSAIKGFIETCFNCEGDYAKKENRLSFNTVSKEFTLGLKHLLSKFGILTTYQYINRDNPKHNNVARFSVKTICNAEFLKHFKLLERKMPKESRKLFKSRYVDGYYLCNVREVVNLGYEDTVYDFTVSDTHSFVANGILTHNCHHVGAASYKVLFNFPAMFRLGLTATKMRNDGLVDVVDIICGGTVFDGSKLKSDAIIAPENILIKVRKSNAKWYYKKSYYDVKTLKDVHSFVYKGNQFVEGTPEWRDMCIELEALGKIKAYPLRLHEAYAKIANDDNFNRMICADIKKNYNEGKSCIVFCKTIEQLDNLYEMLLPSCPKIQKFYGNMGDSKEEVLKKAESKEVLVTLATVAIATEGTNVKSWEVGFLVSSVANEKDLIQIIGRLRRTKEGKEKIIFYDYRHPFVSGICYHGYKRDIFYKNMGIFNTEVE